MSNVRRLISLGRYSDAVKQLDSSGVHGATERVLQILLDKHPQVGTMEAPPMKPCWIAFEADDVKKSLMDFPNGSTGGPFGLTELHIKQIVDDPQIGDQVYQYLATYAGLFVSGKFPRGLAPYYGGARLIPLMKKDNGVRPMAVGDTLRRLCCKMALEKVSKDVQPLLRPRQLGVGTILGCEAIIHSVAAAMENLQSDQTILQIDFSNAFNLVSREMVFEVVEQLPLLHNLVSFLYGDKNLLRVGSGIDTGKTLLSCVGVQQGCPLAPLLFALVLQKLVSKLPKELDCNLWYLDDGHLVGNSASILTALETILSVGPSLGLHLNLGKCVIYGNNLELFPSDIRRQSDGLMVLGAPVGSDDFVLNAVLDTVSKAAILLFKSREIIDPQMELLLLRCCTGAPKMIFWQRTCSPDVISSAIDKFDQVVDDSLQHIFGVPIGEDYRKVVHLPLSMGGIGIPIARLSSNAAFVSSVGASWHLQPSLIPRFS